MATLLAMTAMGWPWDKPAPEPEPESDGMPWAFVAMRGMFIMHGLVLDIVIINLLPFISAAAADAQRADKFPWALGGYTGFPKVPNLDPTHRRFMAENTAYALLRLAPAALLTCVPLLMTAVISYLIEVVTIFWEVRAHPRRSLRPGACAAHSQTHS